MRKRENNRLNAYNRVLGLINNHNDLFEGIPVFKDAVDDFRSKMDEIYRIGAEIKKGSKPAVAAKQVIKRELSKEGAAIAGIIALYAYDQQNVEMESEAKFTFSDLLKSRDAVFDARIQNLLDLAEKHADALEAYSLTSAKLAAFKSSAVEFSRIMEAAGEAISMRVANNKRSSELLNEIEELLSRRIDRILHSMKTEYPDLYNAYRAARKIVDL